MNLAKYYLLILLAVISLGVSKANAETAAATLEQSMSQALDLWRDGQYEQLYEKLSHRGRTSREQFVSKMREAARRRPACCWQKIENFSVLKEKRTEVTVYAKIGLEGTPGPVESCTREVKLSHAANEWKMQLNDILNLAGITGRKIKK